MGWTWEGSHMAACDLPPGWALVKSDPCLFIPQNLTLYTAPCSEFNIILALGQQTSLRL